MFIYWERVFQQSKDSQDDVINTKSSQFQVYKDVYLSIIDLKEQLYQRYKATIKLRLKLYKGEKHIK